MEKVTLNKQKQIIHMKYNGTKIVLAYLLYATDR